MCGRFLFEADVEELIGYYKIVNEVQKTIQKGAVFPSQEAPVIIDNRRLGTMAWGFSTSFSKKILINARSESVHQKKLFADAFFKRRCLIPVNAYYEWNTLKEGYTIRPSGDDFFSLGGIYSKDETGIWKFVVLTKEALGEQKNIHHRMPVILQTSDLSLWLQKETPVEKLRQILHLSSQQALEIVKGII